MSMILTSSLPSILGPLRAGRYIQIGMGLGFYVPETEYLRVQALANITRKVQFLGVTREGVAIIGDREEILTRSDSAGLVAWIVPQGSEAATIEGK